MSARKQRHKIKITGVFIMIELRHTIRVLSTSLILDSNIEKAQLRQIILSKFYNLLDLFRKNKASILSLYRFYDYKILLKEEFELLFESLYYLFRIELEIL